MTLGEMITYLEAKDGNLFLPYGLGYPHSYRGYYERLAFELASSATVAEWIADLRSCIGRTFQGWKGGEYTMEENSLVHIAKLGCTGEPVTRLWLDALIALAERK